MNIAYRPDPAKTIEVSRLVNAPRALVFKMFTEAKHIYMSLTNDRQSRFWSLILPAEE